MASALIAHNKLTWYRNNLMRRTYFIPEQIDGVLQYLHEYYREVRPRVPFGFTKDLLWATKTINRFAKDNEIRFEDAVLVLHEYATTDAEADTDADK